MKSLQLKFSTETKTNNKHTSYLYSKTKIYEYTVLTSHFQLIMLIYLLCERN